MKVNCLGIWAICAIFESQMMKRTPKSECTRKIEQDRSILKILTFDQHLQKSQLFFENWMFAQFSSLEWRNGSQNWNVLEKLSGTGPFWNFWFLIFFFCSRYFFLPFFFLLFGPGQTCGSKPGRIWTKGQPVFDDDVINDVMERVSAWEAASACERVRAWGIHPARVSAWRKQRRVSLTETFAGTSGGAWRRVARRLGLEFRDFVDRGTLVLLVSSVFWNRG